ncbi:Zinc finger protein 827 [Dissostichus eleginoides]|uniref:Zinc finger protein 827 n=1 Tax=Dissostichus eleginoides TaxID=100907 RepID=A0AAD9BQ15_DISEL|nr:Zinc finger protein 827 [Dissostichus eleginoides]
MPSHPEMPIAATDLCSLHKMICQKLAAHDAIVIVKIGRTKGRKSANQRESLKSPFHMKEEPKAEEALSPRPSSQSQSQVQPSFPATFCHNGPMGAAERLGSLKQREGSPMTKNNLLNQDINIKVASELLMKLSGRL